MYFPTAEITCNPLLPLGVAFCISFCTSMGGISGGFLLLPFQMSVLGYTNPSVSATNHFFNIIACPAGVVRYAREGRLLWPVALTIALGTLPGAFLGAVLRIELLPDPKNFTLFAGAVLCYIGLRMAHTVYTSRAEGSLSASGGSFADKTITLLPRENKKLCFRFQGKVYTVDQKKLVLLSAAVGLLGGMYGIGGGALMSPFLISLFGLPVYVVAGATLMATAITSFGGASFYAFLAQFYPGLSVAPDWRLGCLIGIGGMIGMYFGARCQKYVSQTLIKICLVLVLLGTGLSYIF